MFFRTISTGNFRKNGFTILNSSNIYVAHNLNALWEQNRLNLCIFLAKIQWLFKLPCLQHCTHLSLILKEI